MKKETNTTTKGELLQDEKWKVADGDDDTFKIWSNTGNNFEKFVCEIGNKERADLIVQAVNNHAHLVEETNRLFHLASSEMREANKLEDENKKLLDSNRELLDALITAHTIIFQGHEKTEAITHEIKIAINNAKKIQP